MARSSASTRRLAASSMLRLNSTVMALSPLGKRRGGGSVAAMASELSWLTRRLIRIMLASPVACFGREWNSHRAKSASKFNKLIRMPMIRCCDRAPFREPLTRHPRFARCATFSIILRSLHSRCPCPPKPSQPCPACPPPPSPPSCSRRACGTSGCAARGRCGRQPRLVGPAFTLRFVPAREDLATPEVLVVADFDARRDRSDAGRLHRRGRRHGRHRRRHLWRYSLRAHGQARRDRADHRRRRARFEGVLGTNCRCGARALRRRLRLPA